MRSGSKYLIVLSCFLLSYTSIYIAQAQTLQYTRNNAFVNYPDKISLVANIAGNHHLIRFLRDEKPVIYIFDNTLTLINTITLPIVFTERAEIQTIPFADFYYLYLHKVRSTVYYLFKIKGDGNFSDVSGAFQKLMNSLNRDNERSVQFLPGNSELSLITHKYMGNIEKNRTSIIHLDSVMNVTFTNKILYDIFPGDEVKQEMVIGGKQLVVLKTGRKSTILEIMKVNLLNAFTITNTFKNSGSVYSQCSFDYCDADSSFTIYSLLREPSYSFQSKRSVFISKLDNSLNESTPFVILKSPFSNRTYANFFLVNKSSNWVCFKADPEYKSYMIYEPVNQTSSIESARHYGTDIIPLPDYTSTDLRTSVRSQAIALPLRERRITHYSDPEIVSPAVRFSMLDIRLKISSDTLFSNRNNAQTIEGSQFITFSMPDKYYMLIPKLFNRKRHGLLLISNEGDRLNYKDLIVNDGNDYLLNEAQQIPLKGVIIPYMYKREAGLLKITLD